MDRALPQPDLCSRGLLAEEASTIDSQLGPKSLGARLMDSSARFVGAAQSTKEVGSASGMSQERALKDWSDGLSSGK